MNTFNRIVFLTLVLALSFSFPANAGLFSKSHNEKAQEFIKARMFDKAIGELEKEIDEHPTNAEAHFQLGIIYFNKQSYGRAEERFNSAFSLDSRYGPKISRVYEQSGNMYLNRTFITKAINNYRQALRYDPNLRDNILEKCFQKIIFLLDPAKRLSGPAENLTAFIRENTSVYNEKIKKTEEAYARQCLQIAKSQPKAQRQLYIEEARKYLTQKEINEIIPPPSWKTVWGPKKFVGIGYTGGKFDNQGGIPAFPGKITLAGDKAVVNGNNYEVWHDGGWKKHSNQFQIIYTHGNGNGFFSVRASRGEKIIIELKRFE